MKRIMGWLLFLVIAGGALTAWLLFGATTAFDEKSRYFIVREGQTNKEAVLAILKEEKIVSGTTGLQLIGSLTTVWPKLKVGKYEVKKGQSAFEIARMLRNGKQAELRLVINKLRTKADLARLIGKQFATDSAAAMVFLSSNDSLKQLQTDTTLLFTQIIPDTYIFYWNTPLIKIMRKLKENAALFWQKNNRLAKATAKGLSPTDAYTLASIVEEETNFDSDKYKIASVYLNRLKKEMPLQACPTIKYAMQDFTITRIYEKYLLNPSPYNTYRRKGLPPGPICTPSPKTIDIILEAPITDYLFFVAKSDFSGYHHFSSSYQEHDQYAKEYQHQLDIYMANKK
ncbi:endolytic transglycosylase MltG [Sediminibacterium sp.]|uniref:endolytic transglycosylase MltG n=1 Tax=Sediminibacterium sp. TaxID=1917865 RepID=UPI0025D7275D|nr:endolytic transglycosylase MltG [Sediminibacterium sp.]MBW0178229.1 endolytic transglycosylase MltG [Sediminibacterium sp.]